jgi:hypothetical protein
MRVRAPPLVPFHGRSWWKHGRHTSFRSWRPKGHGSSTLPDRTRLNFESATAATIDVTRPSAWFACDQPARGENTVNAPDSKSGDPWSYEFESRRADHFFRCPPGETGRRTGPRIQRRKAPVGSMPTAGTICSGGGATGRRPRLKSDESREGTRVRIPLARPFVRYVRSSNG